MLDIETKVYVIEPHVHGNGGWCGQTILDEGPLWSMLTKPPEGWNPFEWYGEVVNLPRICSTNKLSHDNNIFIWGDGEWEKLS